MLKIGASDCHESEHGDEHGHKQRKYEKQQFYFVLEYIVNFDKCDRIPITQAENKPEFFK
jgi:hypothetical protein